MNIQEEPKEGGKRIGRVLDVVIDTANVIVETTKELPSERRLNILFPFSAALVFLLALFFVVKSIIIKSENKETILNDRQDKMYEERKADFTNRLRISDSINKVKDSTILMLTRDKIESNDKTIQTQELLKKLLRKK